MQVEDRLEELYQARRDLQSLLEHKGWVAYKATIDQQIRVRRTTVFQKSISDLSGCFELTRLQAETAGLQLALAMPELIMADITEDIAVETAKEEEDATGN